MKRALIFDFGNVIMKTRDHVPRHRWDDHLGLKHGTVESIVHNDTSWKLAQIGQISVEDYWSDVAQKLSITDDQIDQLAADFYSGDVLDDSLVDWIQKRRQEEFPVALLSNDSLELREKLTKLGIDTLFDPLVISAEIGVMKPEIRAYQTVLDHLNCPAPDTIFIDDRAENVYEAKHLGIHSILYKDGMDLDTVLGDLLYT